MRKIRDVLRLRLAVRLSIRQIKASTKVSVGAIQQLLVKADELELSWPLPPELDDNQLARPLYPGADTTASCRHQVPDWSAIHQEPKRKGMTKQLLWEAARDPSVCRQALGHHLNRISGQHGGIADTLKFRPHQITTLRIEFAPT
jgi:hypothetical protein